MDDNRYWFRLNQTTIRSPAEGQFPKALKKCNVVFYSMQLYCIMNMYESTVQVQCFIVYYGVWLNSVQMPCRRAMCMPCRRAGPAEGQCVCLVGGQALQKGKVQMHCFALFWNHKNNNHDNSNESNNNNSKSNHKSTHSNNDNKKCCSTAC